MPSIRNRAFKIALIVGTILMMINHGDKLLWGGLLNKDIFKIVLTYFVPYAVSTYAAVWTWYEEQNK